VAESPSCEGGRRSLPAATTATRRLPSVPGVDATIEVRGLCKRFGQTVALDGLSFTVTPGNLTGLIGPNGAGKSTTMRVILGLDAADDGTALIGGRPYSSLRHPLHHVGSLLDASALHPSRSARDHLLWLAHSQGLSARRVDEVIEQAGLQGVARRKAGGFSLGMRQRLGLAAALLADPPVLNAVRPGRERTGSCLGIWREQDTEAVSLEEVTHQRRDLRLVLDDEHQRACCVRRFVHGHSFAQPRRRTAGFSRFLRNVFARCRTRRSTMGP
jgi:ABC-type transport system involved in cytochrome c biogenesis ATPase subunit